MLQLARQSAARSPTAQRALRLREEELLAKHGAELAGPLPADARLCWRNGFVRELEVSPTGEELDLVLAAFEHSAFAMLERLSVRMLAEAPSGWPAFIGRLERAPATLRALALECGTAGELDLGELPKRLERLDLRGYLRVRLPELPALVTLALGDVTEIEGLEPSRQPKLARVVCQDVELLHAFRGLELHYHGDEAYMDFDGELGARRAVVTRSDLEEIPTGSNLAVRTHVQAAERAFLVFEGGVAELDHALERLRKTSLEGTVTAARVAWPFGARRLTAVELRSSAPQPSLLQTIAHELANVLQRGVLEMAESPTRNSSLLRGYERVAGSVTTWIIGRSGGSGGLRSSVGRLFGFDPGLAALDELLLLLDGASPVTLRGRKDPEDVLELPCCSPLEADFRQSFHEDEVDPADLDPEEDEYYEVYEATLDAAAEAYVAAEVVQSDDASGEDPDDDPDEPHRDAADADVHELLTESPVELDDEPEDGLEPKTETGLEQEVSFDGVSEVVVCETCRRHEAQLRCHLCNGEVCEACLATEAPPTCRECRATATHQDNVAPRASAPTFMRRSR